tara:strand:+ start:1321 stop:1875 length:555 start_codon:yes stop_codon:yes gene_type:complete
MNHIEIGNTDVFLEDLGEGKGKITISDTEGFNFSHYWGSMGGPLDEFILQLDEGYFSMKLKPIDDRGVFCSKRSVSAIRKFIKEEYSYELPWYAFKEFQKELREELREISKYSHSEEDFVRRCEELRNHCWYSDGYKQEKEFKEIMDSLFQEPWHFIVKTESNDTIFLKNLLPKLKKVLTKQLV